MTPAAAPPRWPRYAAWLLALPLLMPAAFLAAGFADIDTALWAHLSRHLLPQALANTLTLAVLLAAFVLVPGLGFAWVSARYDYPGRRVLDWALVLPLAIPGYVVAFVYVGLLDYAGPVQSAWRAWFGATASLPNGRGVVGAALMLALVLYPYVYLLARAAFVRQGSVAMDAARSLGHGPLAAFFRGVLPLTRPAWVAGLTLAVLEALADFGAVSLLGVDTLTTTIYRAWFGLYSLPTAAQLAFGLLALVALVLLLERLARGRARYAERSLRPQPRRPLRGWRGWTVALLATGVVLLGFAVPLWRLATWAWSARGGLPVVGPAALNTLALGALATLLVLALALLFALLARRAPGDRGVAAASFIVNLGYAVPGTVLAVGAMVWLVRVEGWLAGLTGAQWALSSSLLAVLFALSARFLRVGHGAVESAFATLRPSLLETARSLAVPAWRRFTGIVLPLLRPGLVAGALLVLVEVMKELPATLMLRPFGWDTLAIRIYAYAAEGLWMEAAWPALLLSLVGLLPVWWLVRQQR
ncbi:MAG: ABC transporter permease [Rehaibacterium terrae]|uniref:ABC transporter permease n=1 Tax=Rehaibacterium terrae TaxID=1341696 RepID=UPI00391C856B